MASNNPIAAFYEAQTATTAEIVHAALDGTQRVQHLLLQMMRSATSPGAKPDVEQGARLQREIMQAFAEMNSEIVRASYAMMERMRDSLGGIARGSVSLPAAFAPAGETDVNPMALYDATLRQWQTTVQQMMETPSVALAVADAADDHGVGRAMAGASRTSMTHKTSKSTRARKRKSAARKR